MNGGFFPRNGDGGQGEAVRVPLADGTLVVGPRLRPLRRDAALAADALRRHGHRPPRRRLRAASSPARRSRSSATAPSACPACWPPSASAPSGSSRCRATPTARQLAREFGATDIVAERGEEAVELIKELTGGVGVDATLECVGTGQSIATALAIARPGSTVGYVGVPHGVELPVERHVLPQRRRARRPGAGPRLHPRAARRRARRSASTRAACSTTRPTSTASPTPTPRWTSGARSSRSYAWGRSDGRTAPAHRARAGDRARELHDDRAGHLDRHHRAARDPSDAGLLGHRAVVGPERLPARPSAGCSCWAPAPAT